MSKRAQELLGAVLQLDAGEQAEIAVEIISRIDGKPDPGSEAAWAAEIERRATRVLAEGSLGEDWETVRARIERENLRRS